MLLQGRQGSAAQQLALQLPGQRLGFASQRANVLGQLGSQAFQNRSSLASLGNQITNSERNFRLQTATRFNNRTQEGSLGQGLLGAVAAGGKTLGTFSKLGGLFGSGGGGGSSGLGFTPGDVGFGDYLQGFTGSAAQRQGPSFFGGQNPLQGINAPTGATIGGAPTSSQIGGINIAQLLGRR